MDVHKIIGRQRDLFADDIAANEHVLCEALTGARVLIYGGAGSIGRDVVGQIFRRAPAALHVVDLSENNLVELVRDLRSTLGYIEGETLFLPIDMASVECQAFLSSQKPYDYVLNLAAMKHVRSEKDAYSLMRMIHTNVFNTLTTLEHAQKTGAKKYFAVSTDKAKNPANLMGATKRIMEGLVFESGGKAPSVSTARFANVAFSDGSLLHGFRQRLLLRQPITAPRDVRRYFVTGAESGELCLASLVLGKDREILFPKLDAKTAADTFSEIAGRFLFAHGYEPVEMSSEGEARASVPKLIPEGKWPCYFFNSDTSGEKPFEEFYSNDDDIEWRRFSGIGVIRVPPPSTEEKQRLHRFVDRISAMRKAMPWDLQTLTAEIQAACPELQHVQTGRSLDNKM